MKTMKKIASLTLALILALALAVPSMAATVTITPPEEGTVGNETYTAYKIFDAVIVDETGNQPSEDPDGTTSTFESVIYTIDSSNPFFDAINGFEGITLELVAGTTYAVQNTTQEGGTFTFSAADLADVLMAVTDKGTPIASTTDEAPNTLVLEDGYFLIIGSLGSNAILDTFGQDAVNIQTKNELPALTLKVKNSVEADTDYDPATSANYAETVTFQVEITLPSSASGDMTVTINKAEGLTYDEDAIAALSLTADEVTAALAQEGADKGKIIKTFTATLNEGVEATDYVTTATLTTGAYITAVTDATTATVTTYSFELLKTNSSNEMLNGAKFTLWDALTDGNQIELDTNNQEDIADNTITAGNVTVSGLRAGTYYLQEDVAPQGYNKVADRIEIVIETANRTGEGKITVINLTGAELPSTGGIGTTIFYIVGGLLAVGAVVLLITRKRAGEQE